MRAKAKGHGDILMWRTLTVDEAYNTMTELINNPIYKKNIKTCSDILQELPNAKDELIFCVNHILKFGGSHLRPPAADMGVLEFFMVDVIVFVLVVICVVLLIMYKCSCFIFRKCRGSGKVKEKKS